MQRLVLRVWSPSLVLTASLGCLPPATLSEPPAPSPSPVVVEPDVQPRREALAGEVIVPLNAWLHARPNSDIRFRILTEDPVAQDQAARFRVLEEHGDWVELEAGTPDTWPARSCVETNRTLHSHGLRVFVERERLLEITTRTVDVSFEDGTGIRLRPGTPVGPAREDGWRLIDTVGAEYYLPVPEDALGSSFDELGPERSQTSDFELDEEPTFEFGGGELLHTNLALDANVRALGSDGPQITIVELDTRCFTAVVRTPTPQPQPLQGYGVGGLGLIGTGSVTTYVVEAGATVYWADGSEAGRRRVSTTIRRAPTEKGSLLCFEESFGYGGAPSERSVDLCYEPAAVVRQTSP